MLRCQYCGRDVKRLVQCNDCGSRTCGDENECAKHRDVWGHHDPERHDRINHITRPVGSIAAND